MLRRDKLFNGINAYPHYRKPARVSQEQIHSLPKAPPCMHYI